MPRRLLPDLPVIVFVLSAYLLSPLLSFGQAIKPVLANQHKTILIKNTNIRILEDKTQSLTFQDIQSAHFTRASGGLPNFGFTKSTIWIHFSIKNIDNNDDILIRISNPNLDSVVMYLPNYRGEPLVKMVSGNKINSAKKKYDVKDVLFNISVRQDSTQQVYLKIKSKNQMFIPLYVGSIKSATFDLVLEYTIMGVFFGIIIIMAIFNLFLYISTRERSYFWFVIYLLGIFYTIIALSGLGYQYLWHHSTFVSDHSTVWAGVISGVLTGLYAKIFLELPKRLPIFSKIVVAYIFIDLIAFVLSLFSLYYVAYQLINIVAVGGCVTIFLAALKLALRGYRPAMFFLIGFSSFLICVIFFVMGTYNLLPYSIIKYSLQVGVAMAVALFSFALADKINVYRKEKEQSQEEALNAALEKERFISQQNILLDKEVKRRTGELQETNNELKGTLTRLQSAQSKLIEAEKMSSLGQLTAGIAHEINNPINFIKSNLKPLTLDVRDLTDLLQKHEGLTEENLKDKLIEINKFKKEINLDYLLNEIHQILEAMKDGTNRTADIVKGLRIFSHVDEDDAKEASLNDEIETTLTLLKSTYPHRLAINRNYGDIPPVECLRGKMNQVFMNLLGNALQAINEIHPQEGGILSITTERHGEMVSIIIEDNGPGIPESQQTKIFDPFFTTKKVGEGTGLGLAISYGIIKDHNGTIELTSEVGKGTSFKITIPVKRVVITV